MTVEFVADLASRSLWIILLVSAPILGLGLAVGVAVSIFQAVTQIQEMTLANVPKIFVTLVVIMLFLPLSFAALRSFMEQIMQMIVGI